MFLIGGQPLSPDVPFEHDGINYPANWLRLASVEEREAVGITEVPDPAPYDARFYWGYSNEGDLIPKDHDQLIEQWTQQTRNTAGTLLAPTDWIIIREADNGKVADPNLKSWREDIRKAAGTKISAISATTDTPSLAAYITSSEYTKWPSDPYNPSLVLADVPPTDGMVTPINGGDTGSGDAGLA